MLEADELLTAWEKQDNVLINSAIDAMLKSTDGRKALWWLLRIGKVNQQPYTGEATSTTFNCGELNVGQQILARILEVSPEGYINMVKENQDEQRDRDGKLNGARNRDFDRRERNESDW